MPVTRSKTKKWIGVCVDTASDALAMVGDRASSNISLDISATNGTSWLSSNQIRATLDPPAIFMQAKFTHVWSNLRRMFPGSTITKPSIGGGKKSVRGKKSI